MPDIEAGLVSVVVVNYRNAAATRDALEHLSLLEWPGERIEVVVVDNASGDGSAEAIRAAHPDVELVVESRNTGFAGGVNAGSQRARGEYLALLNNDARPDPRWLAEAVAVLEADAGVACVASRVVDWDGETVDYAGAALSFYGHGFKLGVGAPVADHADDRPRDVLFATGSAMVVRHDVFRSLGGFDPRYFMFFEDVDLGWRLWLFGHRVRYVPTSVVHHRHHGTVDRFGSWNEHFLLERNALYSIYKNYDDRTLARVLPAALALAVRRGVVVGRTDATRLDLEKTGGDPADGAAELAVAKNTLAPVYAIDAFLDALPALAAERERVQAQRVRSDRELFGLFGLPLHPNIDDPAFVSGFEAATDAFGIEELFPRRRRVVVATGDILTERRAGPAIRAWEMARVLAADHEVRLITTQPCEISSPDFDARHVSPGGLRSALDWCDVFIFQGYLMHEHPVIAASDKVVVVDLYDPMHLEQLEQARDLGAYQRSITVRDVTGVLNQQIARGDFFLCASPKQRDFWLGQLAAVGRINPATYDQSADLSKLIDIVPFGVPDEAPRPAQRRVKGVIDGIGPDDKVVLWGGGIYNWFDPLALIRAVDGVRTRCPEIRLLFMGGRHPNPNVPEMRMAVAARDLADELGLTGRHVFFNDDWVPYDERVDYLLEADIGVSTHVDHVETAFSFRTRILDYLWAGLPVVATAGDSLAERIERSGAGVAVPAGDTAALEKAIEGLLTDEAARSAASEAAAGLAASLRWRQVLQPLVEFCRTPQRAPDLAVGSQPSRAAGIVGVSAHPSVLRRYVARAGRLFRDGGPVLVARTAGAAIARRVRAR